VHSLNVAELCFHIRPDDGSFELKHVAEILILIYIYTYIVVLLIRINDYIIAMHSGMVPIKGVKISWLDCAVESKAYLRRYSAVFVSGCMHSCNCT